jgi:hypothetical protein
MADATSAALLPSALGLCERRDQDRALTPLSLCFQALRVRVTKCRRPNAYQLSDIYMTAVDGGFDLF